MEVVGIIKKIGDLFTSPSGFQKRDMVVVTEEQYPQPLNLEFLGDKSDLPEVYKEGEKVRVSVNLRGREWVSPDGEVKYFNTIVGWRIEKIS